MNYGWKRWTNCVLPLLAIGLVLFYRICGSSCTYLKGGFFGIDMAYLGLVYAGLLVVLAFLNHNTLYLFLLSLGVGSEIYLVGFQVTNGVYCPYCLVFALIVCVLFVINLQASHKFAIGVLVIAGYLFFSLFFSGTATPAFAQTVLVPSYGTGKVQVRIYTDYFCGPCEGVEPKLERLLVELVRKNVISLIFVDTPIHGATTTLYARYLLYILNEKNDFEHALYARRLLFEAAKSKIATKENLEEFLKKKKLPFKPFEAKPTFEALTVYLRADGINRTPTCVIYDSGGKRMYNGPQEIIQALELLK